MFCIPTNTHSQCKRSNSCHRVDGVLEPGFSVFLFRRESNILHQWEEKLPSLIMVIGTLLPEDWLPAASSLTNVLSVCNELILRIHLHHIKDDSHDGITVHKIMAASLGPVHSRAESFPSPSASAQRAILKEFCIWVVVFCFLFSRFLSKAALKLKTERQIRNRRSRLAEFWEAQRSTTQLAYRCYGNSKPNRGGWMEERSERKYGKVKAGMAQGAEKVR